MMDFCRMLLQRFIMVQEVGLRGFILPFFKGVVEAAAFLAGAGFLTADLVVFFAGII